MPMPAAPLQCEVTVSGKAFLEGPGVIMGVGFTDPQSPFVSQDSGGPPHVAVWVPLALPGQFTRPGLCWALRWAGVGSGGLGCQSLGENGGSWAPLGRGRDWRARSRPLSLLGPQHLCLDLIYILESHARLSNKALLQLSP